MTRMICFTSRNEHAKDNAVLKIKSLSVHKHVRGLIFKHPYCFTRYPEGA